jgi:glycosyltransferase involved in cell wall biosynthesis
MSAADDRKRIVFVASYPLPGRAPVGGVEVSTARLAAALSGDYDVTIVAPGPPGTGRDGGVTIVYAGEQNHPFALARSLRPWRRRVGAALAELEPDIVHAQGLLGPGIAATDAFDTALVTAHGNIVLDATLNTKRFPARLRVSAVRRLAIRTTRRAETVVGVHPDWRVNVPVEPKRFVHIPNMVDDLFFAHGDRAGAGDVLYCGGPRRIKGWDVLAEAWPAVARAAPGARLRVIGWSGATNPWSGLERVHVQSWATQAELAEAMSSAAAVVIPSRFEVSPLTLYEAWAAGVPVVAAAGGGLVSLAAGAAALVPTEDPGPLAEALARVLTHPAEAAAAVAAGRERAERARPAAVVEAHRRLYESGAA